MPSRQHGDVIPIGLSAPKLLPVCFTDSSVISVPIRVSVLEGPAATPFITERASNSWVSRLGRRWKRKETQDFILVRMTRGEYLKYCAKDEEGKYVGTEPEDDGTLWLREKLVAEGENVRRESCCQVGGRASGGWVRLE